MNKFLLGHARLTAKVFHHARERKRTKEKLVDIKKLNLVDLDTGTLDGWWMTLGSRGYGLKNLGHQKEEEDHGR